MSFGSGFSPLPESITPNAAGDIFVGQAGPGQNADAAVREFNSTGTFITSFAPLIEEMGTDWIDLSRNQCTLLYTSEGTHVKAFNVCVPVGQLPNFSGVLPGLSAYAVKIRQNDQVLVADTSEVTLLDTAGTQIHHYLASSIEPSNKTPVLFALTLDPDGETFWVADVVSGDVFKVDIATGTVITQFNTATSCVSCGETSAVAGLTLKGEITVANPPPDCSKAAASAPTLWPPNHKFVSETIVGVTDVSAPFTINIDAIDQDESTQSKGSGHTCPDGTGVGTDTAMVRAERDGPGKGGRTYHIDFTATDTNGNTCSSDVTVCVPHDQGHGGGCVDGGELFDSTVCSGEKASKKK